MSSPGGVTVRSRAAAFAVAALVAGLLASPPAVVSATAGASPARPQAPIEAEAGYVAEAAAATDGAVVLVAGDIADCGSEGDEATAALLDRLAGTVLTVGDNAYPSGTTAEFRECYGPSWGRHASRTRPSPGNHDYGSAGAAPYFAYFGATAGPAGRGYYSFDLGAWHVVSLNSNAEIGAGSAQERWLRADLAASPARCTLAYWHHPLFSSGAHGSDRRLLDIWRTLYEFGVEVVLNGHEHNYERFGRQTPAAVADPARGIRQFVVGTGGAALRPTGAARANSRVRDSSAHGVLRLALRAADYDWQFIPVAGQTFSDSGYGECNDPSAGS